MIRNSKESTKAGYDEIKESQLGVYKPLKTRFEHFNTICHGGVTRQKIYTIGALSSFGKSHILRQIETDIFDEELNPGSRADVILIKCDFEMSKVEYILAKVKEKTGKDYSELLYGEQDEEAKLAFNEVYKELAVKYIFETFDTYTPDNFYKEVKPFLDSHSDKKQIILTIDNINLIEGEDESSAMARFMKHAIDLKRTTKNLSIILLAQLNRNLKERVSPKEHFPRTTDFYYSSKIEHASDVQVVIHNPYLLGYMEYGAINKERFNYLSEFVMDKGKYGTFKTKGLLFFHYVKVRMKNNLKDFKDVFIERIFEVSEDDTEVNPAKANVEIPVFGRPDKVDEPVFSNAIMNKIPWEESDEPPF